MAVTGDVVATVVNALAEPKACTAPVACTTQ